MKIFSRVTKLVGLLVLVMGLTCCNKDDENAFDTQDNKLVNDWIYENMTMWYLWQQEMPNNVSDYKRESPYYFFSKLLYFQDNVVTDKWSTLSDDANEWLKVLGGNARATGMVMKPFALDNGQVFGLVLLVELGSPAAEQGIKRGDVIVSVDGTIPTKDNYVKVLYGDFVSAEYELGRVVGNVVEATGHRIVIESEEFQVNPIYYRRVFDIGGKRIGYLAYTSFLKDFEAELTQVFADFKADGVDELVLDLRYNMGGYLTSAIRLASLIAPESAAGKLLATKIWNDKVMAEMESDPVLREELSIEFESLPENLNLKRVYVLTSEWTASASEFVINGLIPYMDVVTIGEPTHGKFVASTLLVDPMKRHNWAIQPIVFKTANANGSTDFWNGLPATITAGDDLKHELGDLDENMLHLAISQITGLPVKKFNSATEMMSLRTPLKGGGILFSDAGVKYCIQPN